MTDTTSMRTFTADNPATVEEMRECIRLVAEAAPDGVNPIRAYGGCAYVRSDDIYQDDNAQPHCIAGEVLSRFFGVSDEDLSRYEGESASHTARFLEVPLIPAACYEMVLAQCHADLMLPWSKVAEEMDL